MADRKIEVLAKVPLFAHCTPRELQFVARGGDEVEVAPGKVLIRQGRPSDTFYVQLAGESSVEVDGTKRRTLKPGDFFGEIGMMDRGPGTATVTVLTPSRFFVMSHAQFRDAVKANDSLMVKVLRVMGARLRDDLEAKRQ